MNNNQTHTYSAHYVDQAWQMLYYTYGLLAIVAGGDKYFDMIVYWNKYLHSAIPRFLGMTDNTVMSIVDIIEIVSGLIIFWRPRECGSIIAAWLFIIVINLVTQGQWFDIAVRDSVMAVGAIDYPKACSLSLQPFKPKEVTPDDILVTSIRVRQIKLFMLIVPWFRFVFFFYLWRKLNFLTICLFHGVTIEKSTDYNQ